MTTSNIHPSVVLEGILSKGGRSTRKENIKRLYEICEERHKKGSRDFSTATIGKLLEDEGIILARAIYNKHSAEYKELIAAWAAYVGPAPPKVPVLCAGAEMFENIADPAVRSIINSLMSENKKLKGQINILKSNTNISIDCRPVVNARTPQDNMVVISMVSQLSRSEREALESAVNHEILERMGFYEGTHGEILNKQGRVLFDVGFMQAVRKILGMRHDSRNI